MLPSNDPDITELVRAVRTNGADFYRTRWGAAERFEDLPITGRSELCFAPLSSRRYKEEKSMVKVCRLDGRPFLAEWSFKDVMAEPYALTGVRPMVLLADSHEAVEKSFWCYDNAKVPLIGEPNPKISTYTAGAYRIDALMADKESIEAAPGVLQARTEPLEDLLLLGKGPAAFEGHEQLMISARNMKLYLTLPETGVFACAEPGPRPVFRTLPGCIIEVAAGRLVLTKRRLLVTPIIRYDTGIAVEPFEQGSFALVGA